MNCKEASGMLAAAVLGDLEEGRRRALHAHLAACDQCLVEESELLQTMHLLQDHADEEREVGVHEVVMNRVAGADQRPVGRVTRTLLTAAATALIVVGLQTILEPSYRGRPAHAPVTLRHTATDGSAGNTLLRGTLFDRRRNEPDEIRRIREHRQGSAGPLPLDL